jgi:hypothetical protein
MTRPLTKAENTYWLFERIMTFGWIRCNRIEAHALLMNTGFVYDGYVYTLNRARPLGAGVYEICKEDFTCKIFWKILQKDTK